MLTSFYLFLTLFFSVVFYIFYKFLIYKSELKNISNNAFLEQKPENNIELAKEKFFLFFEDLLTAFIKNVVFIFHWLLHFFVIFLKFISDFTDVLYAEARNFFLKTATKEKSAAVTFWNHLKEYKKEKEEEGMLD